MKITDEMAERALDAYHGADPNERKAGSGFRWNDISHKRMSRALTAALSPPPVEVRVAVAMDDKGKLESAVLGTTQDTWQTLSEWGYVRRAAIITVRVPLPSVPVVSGVVGEAGE